MIQILLLCTVLGVAQGFQEGAPLMACTYMVPQHTGITAQTSDPPYILEVASNIYRPGQNVTIRLRGKNGAKFKGFMIMARTADCSEVNTPIGRFFLPPGSNMKTLTCIGDQAKYKDNTVTHTSPEDKSAVTLVWTNQRHPDELLRPVYFMYTVVQNYITYWANFSTTTLYDTYKTANNDCAGDQQFGYLPATTTTKMPRHTTYWGPTKAPPFRSSAAKHEMVVISLLASAILLVLW